MFLEKGEWYLKNILILNLSMLREGSKLCGYKSDEGIIEGINTNDAPAKYIIKKLHTERKQLDEIICIKTNEAEKAYEAYSSMIGDFCCELQCDKPEIFSVNGNFEGTDIERTVKDVLSYIEKDDSIYLDTTGGARNSSYLLMFITRFLEFEGIKLEKAVYSIFNKDDSEKNQISDVTELYSMFNLINAANTFTSFGNADELAEIFKDTKNEQIRDVISVLREFSDGVMLCQTNLSDIIERLNKSLNSVSDTEGATGTNEILFCRIIDVIKRKFNISDDKPELDYPDIIRWCIENNLIQQAVTIYNEKIPEYLYRKGYFVPSDSILKHYKKEAAMEYEMYYKGLACTLNETHVMKVLEKISRSDEMLSKVTGFSTFNEAALDNNFRRLIQRDKTVQLQKNMTLLFSVKKEMFNIRGYRYNSDIIEKHFYENPKLTKYKAVTNVKAGTFAGFLKELKNRKDIQNMLFSCNSSTEYTLANFEKMLDDNDDFTISEKITVTQMKEILNDSIYIKNMIRNVVNHASGESFSTPELKNYFKSLGYNVSDLISVKEIKEILTNALDKLTI